MDMSILPRQEDKLMCLGTLPSLAARSGRLDDCGVSNLLHAKTGNAGVLGVFKGSYFLALCLSLLVLCVG